MTNPRTADTEKRIRMLKGEIRKRELLDAAEKLFFSKGYAATTINDILKTQSCSKGSFYHHFDSKLQVLSALCAAHAGEAYARYQATAASLANPLEQMDCLLYESLPVTPEEKDMCALLIPLYALPEGEEVLSSLLKAQREFFFPELCRLLDLLKAQGQAFYPCTALPAVVWDAHTGLYRRLLALGHEMMKDGNSCQPAVQEALDAARYLFERALGLPFGCVTIIRSAVCSETLHRAAIEAKPPCG